jgi:tetratricopeptide (TPR) repeat protein
MNFDQFIDQAWKDHAQKPEDVADRLSQFQLDSQDQITTITNLITHVFGEHLGRWADGINLLEKLQAQADSPEARGSVYRSIMALRLAGGISDQADDLLSSDRVRVLCVASAALSGQKQLARASEYYSEALQIAEEGLPHSDPGIRALAVTGNNLAVELEGIKSRSPQETDLMLLAARSALKYWALAGTWVEHSIAHYRLSKSSFAAGLYVEALEEAMSCLAMCKSNGAGAYDLFWANEALATVTEVTKPEAAAEYVEQMRGFLVSVGDDFKESCEARLRELTRSAE